MKLSFTDKELKNAPKGFTRIILTEKEGKRWIERSGVETLELGVGDFGKVSLRKFRILCRSIIQVARAHKVRKIAVEISPAAFPQLKDIPLPGIGATISEAFGMANFEFTGYKSKPKDGFNLVDEVLICGKTPAAMKEGFKKGEAIAGAVNACRLLSNTPGGDMTPKSLAAAAKKAAVGMGIKVTVLGKKEMEKLGMGAVLGVAKGSSEEPQFIIMEYRGGGSEKPIVLVGKGVTFDTGGLNIKPGDSMYEMHMDMSGGAAVIHAVALVAKLKVKKNVIAIVPAVENMPSGSSYHPGDILKSLSGKTIEVLNTDAEGRVILADGITYAKRYSPRLVVDVATLTGAVLTALGQHASGFMTNEEEKIEEFVILGEKSGDYMWPFPLWDEYEDVIKGNFGDVANIPSSGNTRYAGVINGGMFLWQFAKDLNCPWIHIDMASRMTAAPKEELARGAAGAPVRFLLTLIENF